MSLEDSSMEVKFILSRKNYSLQKNIQMFAIETLMNKRMY